MSKRIKIKKTVAMIFKMPIVGEGNQKNISIALFRRES